MELIKDIRWQKMTPNQKGAVAELIACNWLLMDGYSVYKNVSPWGAADIIALKNGEAIFIDVSVASVNGNGKLSDNKKICSEGRDRDKLNIRFLYVLPDGSCSWRENVFPKEQRECTSCKRAYECKKGYQGKKCNNCRNPSGGLS